MSPRSYDQDHAPFLADLHRYDGWWVDLRTRTGEHYRGHLQTGSVDERHVRLETEFSGRVAVIDVQDIDLIEVCYPPHHFVVPWEL